MTMSQAHAVEPAVDQARRAKVLALLERDETRVAQLWAYQLDAMGLITSIGFPHRAEAAAQGLVTELKAVLRGESPRSLATLRDEAPASQVFHWQQMGLCRVTELFVAGQLATRDWVFLVDEGDEAELLGRLEALSDAFRDLIRHFAAHYCDECRAVHGARNCHPPVTRKTGVNP